MISISSHIRKIAILLEDMDAFLDAVEAMSKPSDLQRLVKTVNDRRLTSLLLNKYGPSELDLIDSNFRIKNPGKAIPYEGVRMLPLDIIKAGITKAYGGLVDIKQDYTPLEDRLPERKTSF